MFGLKSGYFIPHNEVTKYCGDVHVPLARPFAGMRLRKKRKTPWEDPIFMKYYGKPRYIIPKVAVKMLFGTPHAKAKAKKDPFGGASRLRGRAIAMHRAKEEYAQFVREDFDPKQTSFFDMIETEHSRAKHRENKLTTVSDNSEN